MQAYKRINKPRETINNQIDKSKAGGAAGTTGDLRKLQHSLVGFWTKHVCILQDLNWSDRL